MEDEEKKEEVAQEGATDEKDDPCASCEGCCGSCDK